MIDTKKVGRPKKLNRDDVLLKAINVFWERGYDGASMKNLTEAMGINSPGLYAEFGDKEGLYLEAIHRYSNNDACAPLVALENETDIFLAVKAFIEAAIDYSTNHESGVKGCFLVSCVSASSGHVDGSARLLSSAISTTDKRIAARFDLEIQKGNLPENFPSLKRAKLLFDLRQGLVFRARAGVDGQELMEDIEDKVRMILFI